MTNKDASQRPSVDELMQIPKIQLRMKERKMREDYAALKKREQEVHELYEALKQKQKQLQAQEAALSKREEKARSLKLMFAEQQILRNTSQIMRGLG
jgi:predicted nucleotidyltransferase